MTYKKPLLTAALILSLGLAGLATWQFFDKGEEVTTNENTNKPPIVTEVDHEFSLKADTMDSMGVDKASSFTLTSKYPVEDKLIKASLAITPEVGYKLQSSESNTFKIIPEKELKENTIYSFKITTIKPNPGEEKEFAWAYQTEDTFKVTGTLPRDKTTSIPTDSGIEITFSHENFENYTDYIEITPAIEGYFKIYRKTLVFIPEALAPATLYTVKVKEGLPLNGTDQTLSKDTIFKFETKDTETSSTYSNFTFVENFYEYPADDTPILNVYEYNTGVTVVDATVWKFPSFEAFGNAVKTQYQDIPYWATKYRKTKPYPTDSLQQATSFTADLQESNVWYDMIVFPESLAEGYYLVNVTAGENKDQIFLQITPLSAAFYASPIKSFFWVNRVDTKQPVADIDITFSADNSFSAATNSQGLAEFVTPEVLQEKINYSYEDQLYFFTLSDGTSNLLVPTDQAHSSYWGWNSAQNKDYWSYIYPNRKLYQPTDKIHFWGIAKKRNNSDLNKLTVKLAKSTWSSSSENIIDLASTEVNVSKQSTYQGELSFSNINPGYYTVMALDGDKIVSRESVNIETYTKPPYKIEITSPKKAIFEGEQAVYEINTTFFDGTPVSGLELKYNGKLGNGEITTNKEGKAQLTYDTSYTSNSHYPYTAYLNVYPKNSEIAAVSANAYLQVFGPHYDLNLTVKKGGEISGLVYNVSLDKINAEPDKYIWDWQGNPASGVDTNIKIYHQWYEKIETGTSYDFINKKTIKSYTYDKHEDLVNEENVASDAEGKFAITFVPEAEKTYKIMATVYDVEGRVSTDEAYYNSGYNYFGYYYGGSQDYDSYYLVSDKDLDPESNYYEINDQVNLTLNKNESPFLPGENDRIIYFKDQNSIFDVEVSQTSSLSFQFKNDYLPNIFVSGIVFDGRSYHPTTQKIVQFDSDSMELNIKTTSDKANYKPGEKATLNIEVTDLDDNPVNKAEVNVSLIDEALAAISWERWGNIKSKIYAIIPSSITSSYTTHDKMEMAGAEGGGCFTGDTKVLMSDGSEKPIGEIMIGDTVLTKKTTKSNELVKANVIGKARHFINEYLTINGFLKVTPIHIVFLNNAWQPAGQAKPGDRLKLANGEEMVIESIIRQKEPVTVYNLHIEEYNTFFADSIYVHNNKGGRDNFQDIAFFGTTTTNSQGKGTVSFDVPDNITSWQTSVQAVTDDLKVGDMLTAVIVTQPFFVDVSMAENYLTSDNPKIKLRAYGKSLPEGADVQFEVSYPDQDIEAQVYGAKAFETAEVSLPDLAEGNYKIRVKATSGGLEDIITRTFSYLETNLKKSTVEYYNLTEDTSVSGSENGPTNLTFTNKERGQYYRLLKWGIWTGGDRVDQKMMAYLSQILLNAYFEENAVPASFNFSNYQTEEGGISLLPYSSSEILLTAKALATDPDAFGAVAAKEYFEDILSNTESNVDEAVYAYLGLANLGEPVLTDINLLIDNEDVTPELKLYLIRAIANIGAKEYAHTLLNNLLDEYGIDEDPYIKVNLGSEPDDYTEYTYQAAIIAALVDSDKAFKLFDYALNHPAELQLHTLDQLAYLVEALPNLSGEAVSFSYTLSGETKNVSLEKNKELNLALNSDQLTGLSFSDIVGSVGLVTKYQEPLDIASISQDSNLSVARAYYVGNQSKSIFSEDEIVKITITPNISSSAIDTGYRVTDYLPAGLKFLSKTWQRGVGYDPNKRYPYEINGQAVKFHAGTSSDSFNYYAIVTGKGEYKAEAPAIEGFNVDSSKAFGEAQTITFE